MTILIQVLSYQGQAIVPPLLASFGRAGGTIGRGEQATLRLTDPERTVSREQARIEFAGERYWIDNIGSGNSIRAGGRDVASGTRALLSAGDVVEIGAYRLSVQFEEEADLATRAPARPGLPTRTDLTDRPSIPSALDIAAIEIATHAGNLAAQRDASARPPALLPAIEVPATEVRAFVPAAPTGTPPTEYDNEMWRAFTRGAGVEIELPERVRAPLLSTVGSMVRSMVEGLRELVQLRARAKAEFNAERTQIQRRDNNPLKFSRDTDVALKALLQPPRPGFMPGPAAIEDALQDLQTHHLATLAAMRAALDDVARQFEPARIEQRVARSGLLDALVPSRRNAQLWELYVAQYRAMQQEAAARSDQVFNQAFLQAYERETAEQEERARLQKLRKTDRELG